jgi:hypothetical protein
MIQDRRLSNHDALTKSSRHISNIGIGLRVEGNQGRVEGYDRKVGIIHATLINGLMQSP